MHWPLSHPTLTVTLGTLPADSKLSETRMLQFQWGAHQLANKIFADVVLQHYQDGDIVWVQVRLDLSHL